MHRAALLRCTYIKRRNKSSIAKRNVATITSLSLKIKLVHSRSPTVVVHNELPSCCKDTNTWREKKKIYVCYVFALWACASEDTSKSGLLFIVLFCQGDLLKMSAINVTAGFIKNK